MNTTDVTDTFLRRREKLRRGVTSGDGRAADRLDALIVEMRRTLGEGHPETWRPNSPTLNCSGAPRGNTS
jgi:hypothetical protein